VPPNEAGIPESTYHRRGILLILLLQSLKLLERRASVNGDKGTFRLIIAKAAEYTASERIEFIVTTKRENDGCHERHCFSV
jgi:hypothetical protein